MKFEYDGRGTSDDGAGPNGEEADEVNRLDAMTGEYVHGDSGAGDVAVDSAMLDLHDAAMDDKSGARPLGDGANEVDELSVRMAVDSGYDRLLIESALAKRLAREPALRPAQQRRPEQQLNLARRSNVEALFAHIAGEAAAVPCKNCHKGHGPWTACVVVDGQMCGSCANCWFNASGARCSFHEAKTPMQPGHHLHQRHHLSSGGSASLASSTPIDPRLSHPALFGGVDAASLGLAHSHRSAAGSLHPHTQPHPSPTAATTASASTAAAAAAAAVAAAVQHIHNSSNNNSDSASGNNGVHVGAHHDMVGDAFGGFGLHLAAAILGEDVSGNGAVRGDSAELGAGSTAAGSTAGPAGVDSSLIGFVVDQALAEVRNADRRARDLMMVEIAAKQLALAIVRGNVDSATDISNRGSSDDM
ncbi:hypothetical protein CMQ_4556 [Grosmannia clavigera kw1407]|uniref:Uncharacterized protein n=1 Tax=Grosmannia clavigera (strain kw1407 / UAMH 11150) TaxID=655863 RepID=F0XUG7_GROCL|nr:uncharacterized protein CMQ_4556 [Grosmannia clavigera kw1407]EFW98704.1 hypothetical protein CMQ_4556 [Grosmannia clavigera kw1407]